MRLSTWIDLRKENGMLVYAQEFGSYFKDVVWRPPTLVIDELMTEVYASDFVVDAWIEPSFGNLHSLPRDAGFEFVGALRDIIMWPVILGGVCRALKRPLVKVSSVRVFDAVGHGRRRGTPSIGYVAQSSVRDVNQAIGGMYLQAERLLRQRYSAAVIYRAPILYGRTLGSPITRVARASNSLELRYFPEIESNEQMMLAFAGDFVQLLMQQIDDGPVREPINLWPYADSQPLSWYDAALLTWPDKRDLFGREQGYKKRGTSTFVPDVYGDGSFRDGFRRYREEEKAVREETQRALRGDSPS